MGSFVVTVLVLAVIAGVVLGSSSSYGKLYDRLYGVPARTLFVYGGDEAANSSGRHRAQHGRHASASEQVTSSGNLAILPMPAFIASDGSAARRTDAP